MDDFGAKVLGVPELNAALKALEPRKQVNAIRNAARAAMRPVKREAEARVPRGSEPHKTYKGRLVAPGFAARNINVSTYASRDRSKIGATVGTKKEAFYVRQFIEIGTRNIAPQPWLRPSYEANRTTMEREFRRSLRQKIIQQAKKARKPRRR